jgi:hypothetical protein
MFRDYLFVNIAQNETFAQKGVEVKYIDTYSSVLLTPLVSVYYKLLLISISYKNFIFSNLSS